MRKLGQLFLLVALVLPAAGCGKSEAEKESEAAKSSEGRGTITCTGDAVTGASGLPAGFPVLDGVTYTSAVDKGPTRVVDGYSDESLEGMYNEFKDRLKEAEFKVLFAEVEADNSDAEVSYETKDGQTEGQVALRDACDNGNISVHVTARPA